MRLLAAAAVTVGLLAPALPVKADPVLCVTLAYQVLNQPREYVFDDDCVVPSPWNPQIGDGWNCHWLVIGEACYEFAISHPMP